MMQYLGGKFHIRKRVAAFVRQHLDADQTYWEPFVGAAWVLAELFPHTPRIASDIHPDLIMLWQAIQDGWEPPQVSWRFQPSWTCARSPGVNCALNGCS